MLCLSQTTGYAILACCCLEVCTDEWALAKDIARCTDIPKPYLSKVLNALSSNGLLEAKRGYRGGFRFARPADHITLLDVVEGVEGQGWASRCLLGLAECSDQQSCAVHASWKRERRAIAMELRNTTLRDAAKFMLNRGRRSKDGPQPAKSRSGPESPAL